MLRDKRNWNQAFQTNTLPSVREGIMSLNHQLLRAVNQDVVFNAFNFIRAISDADVRNVSAPLHVLSARDERAREAARKLFILLLTVETDKRALTRQLQMALNEHMGKHWSFELAVDGLIGPATAQVFTGYTTEAMIDVFNQVSTYLLKVNENS